LLIDSKRNYVFLYTEKSHLTIIGDGTNQLKPQSSFKAEAILDTTTKSISPESYTEFKDLQSQVDFLTSENKKLEKYIQILEASNTVLEGNNDILNTEKLDLFDELLEWKRSYGKMVDENEKLGNQYSTLSQNNKKLSDAYKIQEKNVDTLKNNQKTLTNALTTQKNDYEDRLSAADRSKIEQLANTNPILKGLLNGKINYYIPPAPSYADPDVNKKTIPNFVKRMDSLSTSLIKYNRVYDARYADIIVDWKKDIGSHLGQSIFKAYNEVGLGGSTCYGQWKPFDSYTVSRILWHEIGHAMGYSHSSNQNNIMYATTPTQFDLDYEKSFSIDEGAVYQMRLCGGSFTYSVSTNEKNQGFSTYVLTSGTNAADFLKKGEGKHYPDCNKTNMISATVTCTAPRGSIFVIYNKDDLFKFNTMNIDLKLDQTNQYPSSLDWRWDHKGFAYDTNWLNDVISKYRN